MSRRDGIGTCEHCGGGFEYYLVHNGFNDSAYAYCDRCGQTAILDGWNVPKGTGFEFHRALSAQSVVHLLPCRCGGAFTDTATPRCPHCNESLSAERATAWIEANAPGTKKGWRWQRGWQALYCIVIEGRYVQDNWRPAPGAG